MKSIKIDKQLSFFQAFLLPIRLSPIITIIHLSLFLSGYLMSPLRVLSTAMFVDKALYLFETGFEFSEIMPSLLFVAGTYLYGYVIDPIQKLLSKRIETVKWFSIQHPLLDSYAGLKLECTENSDTMDLITRVWSQSPDDALFAIYEDCCGFLGQAISIVSCLFIIITSSPLVGTIIAVSSFPIALIARKCGKEKYNVTESMTTNERRIEEYQFYLRSRKYISERNLFCFSDSVNECYKRLRYETKNEHNLIQKKNLTRKFISEIILILLSGISLIIMLPSVASGSITVGLFISIIGTLFSVVHDIAWNLASYFEFFIIDNKYLKDFNEYIMLEKDVGSLDTLAKSFPDFDTLEFKHVSFTYPDTDKKILDDVSFRIEKGKRYSLIGINGSGKTTITKLILRLYSNYDGEILLNGKSLLNWDLRVVKAMFSVVFQDFIKYDISLADNISAGNGLRSTREEIEEAIDAVGLHEYVSSLPNGMDTLLGKIYENGDNPSDGQWQRIAIARTIVSNAQLKILDEPTASLDPVAEKEMYEHFDSISKNAATLFISHRLASAKKSDVIFVLDNGKIVETGSHEELVSNNGLYAEMFREQQGWYI